MTKQTVGIASAFVCIVLAAIMGWYLSSQNVQYDKQADHYAAEFAAHTDQEVLKSCGLTSGLNLIKCLRDELEAERDTKRSEADLAAQQKVAKWSLVAVIISGLSLLFTAGGFWLIYLNLIEARKVTTQSITATNAAVEANRITHDHFTAVNRPWLRFDKDIEIGHYRDEHISGIIFAKVRVRNTGKSVAADVRAHLVLDRMPLADLRNIGVVAFAETLSHDTDWHRSAIAIQDDDWAEVHVDHPVLDLPESPTKLPIVKAILCVTYRSYGSKETLYTAQAVSFTTDAYSTLLGTAEYEVIRTMGMRESLTMK